MPPVSVPVPFRGRENEAKSIDCLAAFQASGPIVKREAQPQTAEDMKPWIEMGKKYGMISTRSDDLCHFVRFLMHADLVGVFGVFCFAVATTVLIPMGMEMMNQSQSSQKQ